MARPFGIAVLVFGACLAFAQAKAEVTALFGADCSGLKLTFASGVPEGNAHQYEFKGTCKKFREHHSDTHGSWTSEMVTLWGEATANWNEQTRTLNEIVSVQGPIGPGGNDGVVTTTFNCQQDPIVYKGTCVVIDHSNTTNWFGFSDAALNQKRPILRGKTTLAQATEFSKKQASSAPPPPAPAAKVLRQPTRDEPAKVLRQPTRDEPAKVLRQPSGQPATAAASMFTVEAEQLLQANKAVVNGGQMTARPVVEGSGTQLFWYGGAVGAVLDLKVDVPAASKYAVELYFTRGPEYADLKIEVDGKPSPVAFSGFAPSVMAPTPTQAGTFSLQPGARNVSFMISGKYQQATGYVVGIDRIVFYPAGPP